MNLTLVVTLNGIELDNTTKQFEELKNIASQKKTSKRFKSRLNKLPFAVYCTQNTENLKPV